MTITIPALSSWKSTLSGVLTATLVATVALLHYPPVQAHPKTVAVLGGIELVAKLWVALITKDPEKITSADITKANVAANFAAAKNGGNK